MTQYDQKKRQKKCEKKRNMKKKETWQKKKLFDIDKHNYK